MLLTLAIAGSSFAQSSTTTNSGSHQRERTTSGVAPLPLGSEQIESAASVLSEPVPLREDIVVTRLASVPLDAIRIDYHAPSNTLVYLTRSGDIVGFNRETEQIDQLAQSADHGVPEPRGMVISSDDYVYLLGNQLAGAMTAGIVRRARLTDGELDEWVTVASTETYPRTPGPFDHLMNGLGVSPDGRYVFISAGSRTDHGEIEDNGGMLPGLREVPLSSIMMRVPADTTDLVLPNDSTALTEMGVRFANGFRNTFDLAWGPRGLLFGTENSGDRDDPEELNLIREGRHYGFPWWIGSNQTPQQFVSYDPSSDPLIGPGTQPVFSNDPGYPQQPPDIDFELPLANRGPDADTFRDPTTGDLMDASDAGLTIHSFTPHRSPLGLVFDTAGALGEPFTEDGLVLSWTGTGSRLLGPLGDEGQDLIHLDLEWNDVDSTYAFSARQLVRGFNRPIDAVLVGSDLYVIEMGFTESEEPSLWRISLPKRSGAATDPDEPIAKRSGLSIFPNPMSSSGRLHFVIEAAGRVTIRLHDIRGRVVERIVDRFFASGTHDIAFSVPLVSPGVYIARMETNGNVDFLPIVRAR